MHRRRHEGVGPGEVLVLILLIIALILIFKQTAVNPNHFFPCVDQKSEEDNKSRKKDCSPTVEAPAKRRASF